MSPERKVGRVVDLRQHAAYKPDLASLAREQVAAGRRKLGLTRQEFAELLDTTAGLVALR